MTVSAALDLLLNLTLQVGRITVMIRAAKAEGRDTLSEAELDELLAEDDQARQNLQDAIERARAEGR